LVVEKEDIKTAVPLKFAEARRGQKRKKGHPYEPTMQCHSHPKGAKPQLNRSSDQVDAGSFALWIGKADAQLSLIFALGVKGRGIFPQVTQVLQREPNAFPLCPLKLLL
jgi:hypothetical protein